MTEPTVVISLNTLSWDELDRLAKWLNERSIKITISGINTMYMKLTLPASDELALRLAFDFDEK